MFEAADGSSEQGLLDEVRKLVGLIEANADETECRRAVPPAVVEAVIAAGVPSMLLPREVGGRGVDLVTACRVVEALCHADGSTGWAFGANAGATAMAYVTLSDEGVDEVFVKAERPPIFAGHFMPRGRAEAVAGGYLVEGNFAFASGSDHADWIAGCGQLVQDGEPILDEAGTPELRAWFLPREKIEFRGNWDDVIGLRGTGSVDYTVPRQTVPEWLVFDRNPANFRPRRGGPTLRLGLRPFGGILHGPFAIAMGQRLLDEILTMALTRRRENSRVTLAETEAFLNDYGRHEAGVRASRAFLHQAMASAEESARLGRPPTSYEIASIDQAQRHATDVALDVARMAFGWAGSATLRPSRLRRAFLDLQAGAQHIQVDRSAYTVLARAALAKLEEGDADPYYGRYPIDVTS